MFWSLYVNGIKAKCLDIKSVWIIKFVAEACEV